MGKKLFVGSLSFNTNAKTLTDAFSQAGKIAEAGEDGDAVVVINDRMTGRSKGFGFVTMATEEDAQKAIEMWNGKELDGRTIVVNEARPREDRPRRDFDRGGDRGGFGGGGRGGRSWR